MFVAGDEAQPPIKPPEWDLSIASLQEVHLCVHIILVIVCTWYTTYLISLINDTFIQ